LPRLLQTEAGLSSEDAKRLVSDMIEFLAPVVEREEKEAKEKKEEVKGLAEKIKAIEPAAPKEVAEKHEAVKPIRTMQADVDKVHHGYGALPRNQDETGEDNAEEVVKATSQEEIEHPKHPSPEPKKADIEI